jgi:hypothetical protein
MTVTKLSLTAFALLGASALATRAFAQAPGAPPAAGAPAAAPAMTFDNMDPKVKTFANLGTVEGSENICQAADGSLFVTLINVSKLMKVDPAGKVSEFASVPNAANMLGVGCGDNEIVAITFGKTFRGTPAVPATATAPAVPARPNNFDDNDVHAWVYDLSGKVVSDVPIPKGMGLNGFAYGGKPGIYYGGNSGRPEIDLINTRTKTATVWYDAKEYSGPPPVPPAGRPIAINGLRVANGWVYFRGIKPSSNPAVPGIYRIQIGADGKPTGTPKTIQEGLATDDFGVAADGSVILPSGRTIYKITTDGVQTKIADPAVGGPSLIVSKDGKTAYWPTRVAGTTTEQRVLTVAIP